MASQLPGSSAPAAPFDISQVLPPPVDYTALLRAARGQANADVATNVSGIRAQQVQLLHEAAQRAAQQQALGLSASRYLESLNLPGLTDQSYAHAADRERAAAQGFSGGLQQTVSDQAAQVQANLARLGSPQTAANPGQTAGNVLFGLGDLDATRLDKAGPLMAATLAALPSQSLAYGQEQATAALGQGQREAAKLQPDILAAQAQRSTLTASYLKTLADQARQSGNDRFAHVLDVLKYQADQNAAQALSQYRADQIAGENARSRSQIANENWRTKVTTDAENRRNQATIAAENARNQASIAAADRRAARTGSETVIGSDRSGRFLYDPGTKTLTPLIPPVGTTPKTTRPLTPSQLKTNTAVLYKGVHILRYGGQDAQGNPLKPLSRAAALNELSKEGFLSSAPLRRLALKVLNEIYGPVEQGIAANVLAGPPVPSGFRPPE